MPLINSNCPPFKWLPTSLPDGLFDSISSQLPSAAYEFQARDTLGHALRIQTAKLSPKQIHAGREWIDGFQGWGMQGTWECLPRSAEFLF